MWHLHVISFPLVYSLWWMHVYECSRFIHGPRVDQILVQRYPVGFEIRDGLQRNSWGEIDHRHYERGSKMKISCNIWGQPSLFSDIPSSLLVAGELMMSSFMVMKSSIQEENLQSHCSHYFELIELNSHPTGVINYFVLFFRLWFFSSSDWLFSSFDRSIFWVQLI